MVRLVSQIGSIAVGTATEQSWISSHTAIDLGFEQETCAGLSKAQK
jgi:hypothetical protein